MQRTDIPWATHSWGVITGCSPASEGCRNCYAQAMAHRFHRPWGSVTFHLDKLDDPKRLRCPSRIFVGSTSDLFHESVCFADREDIMQVIQDCPRHTFIILTKRPERIPAGYDFPENVWLGVTTENQTRYDQRWPILATVKAKVRFISVEPMLGPVSIVGTHPSYPDWTICGPETGRGKRLFDPAWAADLQSECIRLGVAYFDKRDGEGFTREYPGT